MLALLSVVALLAVTVPVAAGDPPDLDVLEPGGFLSIEQDLDINVVFVGFGGYTINTGDFENALPDEYRAIHRYPSLYQGAPEFLGNDFNFNYDFIFADATFEDDFFGWLAGQGDLGGLTVFQDWYNLEASNMMTVTAPVRYIDGPSVEAYLEANGAGMMGDYTVFFINWSDRCDFQFHLYTKTDQADPDTDYNFGVERDSRKMIAWGGSHDRVWFYDFSAGPQGWDDNWAIDAAPGYTIPPIWEYGNPNAYRPFDDLTGDMARITRYIAINLLFTPSPLYKPFLSPPELPASIDLDVNLFEADPDSTGLDWIDPVHIQAQYAAFQPYKTYTVDLDDYQLRSRHDQVFDCFAADVNSCYGQRLFNIAMGDLFLYFSDHLTRYLDGDADYEIPIFAYNTTPEKLNAWVGLLGWADDDWATGTQTFIFEFDNWYYRTLGYGFSTTTVHEAGHHIGFSHPHDGYDYEQDIDYGPGGDFYFVWTGDESDTVMHYMDLSHGFGVFNKDAMYRYETAGYINQANAVLADIYASPKAGRVSDLLEDADGYAEAALAAYDGMDYYTAVTQAQMAYGKVLEAADEINVPVEPQAWQSDVKGRGMQYHIDPVRYPDM
jgi:hypothetical protein